MKFLLLYYFYWSIYLLTNAQILVRRGGCLIEENIDYPFNDIRSFSVGSVDECCTACKNEDLCVMFAFSTDGTNVCWLKHTQPTYSYTTENRSTGWKIYNTTSPTNDNAPPIQEGFEIFTLQNTIIEIFLMGSDIKQPESVRTNIITLPSRGQLYQSIDPYEGEKITNTPVVVTSPTHRVYYSSPTLNPGESEAITSFEFEIIDDSNNNLDTALVSIHIQEYKRFSCSDSNPVIMGEAGTANTKNTYNITFKNTYKTPVVIAQPLSYKSGDDQPASVRITSVGPNGFTFEVQEPPSQDNLHPQEDFSWIVMEAGSWRLSDGTRLEVGKVVTSATVANKVDMSNWEFVQYPSASLFSDPPVIFAQVQTNNDPHWVNLRINEITTAEFSVALEEEKENEITHGGEIIGWVAILPSKGLFGNSLYEVNTTGPKKVTENWYTINWKTKFKERPHFLSMINSYLGADPARIRYQYLTISSVEIKIEEETGKDKHTRESVGWMVIQNNALLAAIASDCYVDAPTAYDKNVNCIEGMATEIQLKEFDYPSTAIARILTLPSKGKLYQFNFEISEIDLITHNNAVVTESNGRVIYVASSAIFGDYEDIFTYRIEKNSSISNTGTVWLSVAGKGPGPVVHTPQSEFNPTDKQSTDDLTNTLSVLKTLLIIVILLFMFMIIILCVIVVFFWKKKVARDQFIEFVSGGFNDGETTYFPNQINTSGDDNAE